MKKRIVKFVKFLGECLDATLDMVRRETVRIMLYLILLVLVILSIDMAGRFDKVDRALDDIRNS